MRGLSAAALLLLALTLALRANADADQRAADTLKFLAPGASPTDARLVQWGAMNGAWIDGESLSWPVELPHGRSVVTKLPVKRGQETMHVPRKLCMTSRDLPAELRERIVDPLMRARGRLLEKIETGMQARMSLALYILYERYQRDASFFAAFLDALPPALHTATWWTRQEQAELQDTEMEATMANMRDVASRAYGVMQRFGKENNVPELARISFDDFKWALEIIQTRSFGLPDDADNDPNALGMFPFLDLINTDPGAHINVYVDEKAARFLGDDTPAGRELFNNYHYGQDAGHALMFYGFAPRHNRFDHLELITDPSVKLSWMSDATHHYEFEEAAAAETGRVSANPRGVCFPPDSTSHRLSAEGSITPRGLQWCVRSLSQALERYPTTAKHDVALIRRTDNPYRLFAAVSYRLSRKKLIHAHRALCRELLREVRCVPPKLWDVRSALGDFRAFVVSSQAARRTVGLGPAKWEDLLA